MVDLRSQLVSKFRSVVIFLDVNEERNGFSLSEAELSRWLSFHSKWYRSKCEDKPFLMVGRNVHFASSELFQFFDEIQAFVNAAGELNYSVRLQTSVTDCLEHLASVKKICECSSVNGITLNFTENDRIISPEEFETFLKSIRAFQRQLTIVCSFEKLRQWKLLSSPAMNSSDISIVLETDTELQEINRPQFPACKCFDRLTLNISPDGLVYPCVFLNQFPDQAIGTVHSEREDDFLRLDDTILEYMVLGPDIPDEGAVVGSFYNSPWKCRRHIAEIMKNRT